MGIRVHITSHLHHHTNNTDMAKVKGNTVVECLAQLAVEFPGIEKELFNEKGELSNILEVFVNRRSLYPDGLTKAVKDGDEIHITLLMVGG